jgi:hypothetical protein
MRPPFRSKHYRDTDALWLLLLLLLLPPPPPPPLASRHPSRHFFIVISPAQLLQSIFTCT